MEIRISSSSVENLSPVGCCHSWEDSPRLEDKIAISTCQRFIFYWVFLEDSKSLREWKNTCESLISSPRAVDSSTAAVLLRLLIDKCPSQLTLTYNPSSLAIWTEECDTPRTEQGSPAPAAKDTSETNGRPVRKLASFSNTPNESKVKGVNLKEIGQNPVSEVSSLLAEIDLNAIPCNRAFSVLRSLVLVLMTHSAVAKESLTQASLYAPMHGVLFCIRQLLSHIVSR